MPETPFDEDAELRSLVGAAALDRGRKYYLQNRVSDIRWSADGRTLRAQVDGSQGARYVTTLAFRSANRTALELQASACTCPVHANCKHAAATYLTVRAQQVRLAPPRSTRVGERAGASAGAPATAPWERTLLSLIGEGPVREATGSIRPLALQFELRDTSKLSTRAGYGSRARRPQPVRLGMRPVALDDKGAWGRTQASWQRLRYGGDDLFASEQLVWFEELYGLVMGPERAQYGQSSEVWLYLDDLDSRSVWSYFDRAAELGIALLHSEPTLPPVRLRAESAEVHLDVRSVDDGLRLEPIVRIGDEAIAHAEVGFIGNPAHGLYLREQAGGAGGPAGTRRAGAADLKRQALQLIRLDAPIGSATQNLLRSPEPVTVPAPQIEDFTTRVLPRLRTTLPVRSGDASFDLPAPPEPTLVLTVVQEGGQGIRLDWDWHYAVPGSATDAATDAGRSAPLWPAPDTPEIDSAASAARADELALRDTRTEQRIVAGVSASVIRFPMLGDPYSGRLLAQSRLRGMTMVDFLQHEVPRLEALERTRVTFDGEVPEYREAQEAVVINLATSAREGDRDWFDLAVEVTVDSTEVPFDQLFVALATGDEYLILPNGVYFRLDDPRFDRLRALITEARGLLDKPGDELAISRYQTGLWDELQEIGIVTAQAEAWGSAVAALSAAEQIAPVELPEGFDATLRGYQQHGYDWLSFLADHGLGGVLADDMGLGKTVQMLATIARQRALAPDAPPFLVVAPTSVVGNWASEAARFAPGLRVATIESTGSRRRTTLAEAVRGADIVVTSYALFRIGFGQYDALRWSGLILDEAQFVKNHQSSTYQCVRRLDAPVKFAITGTPIENNLMELWSMFSIVAPGLFAGPKQFTDYYGTPIEKNEESAPELLKQLRRRIRPLMLRRTKEKVAADLPEKQEQVIEVALNPAQRKIYDTYLQRERQKVLGLIEDLDSNRFQIFRSLTLLRQAALDVSLIDDAHSEVPSTKIDVLFELLEDIVAEGHRVLIFSQFTSFLARVKSRLETEQIEFAYLDGATRKRTQVIDGFRNGTAPVFLISLKSGGVGLNLTEADYCILLDPWWNPATEAQAVDRVHRIGQTKNVMVYRLVASDTIEEKVMTLKDSKAKLFASVMAEGGAAGGSKITGSDIRELLG
ncbi:DEAD/DEAH box helicase [Herbiconiux sp.]|uniref:DEAD/DEAH box helicase n=1 Tax=Herbiconiux sp. TaxID=1871186 RepID=UPI0025C6E141|nr:DEAD/DEAH box helicase [Herbiconiux sp.]